MRFGLGSRDWGCGLSRLQSRPTSGRCILANLPTLAERLRDAGYQTIGVCSNIFLYRPSSYGRGSQAWLELGRTPRQESLPGGIELFALDLQDWQSRSAEHVHRELDAALGRRAPEQPLFLYVHYMDVHDYQKPRRSYADAVGTMDRFIGELRVILERHGILPNARVVLTSDHGERLEEPHAVPGRPAHGGNPSFNEVLRIPLIVRPSLFADTSAPLRSDEIFTKILEVAGVAPRLPPPTLRPGELYLSESAYWTFRTEDWKLSLPRDGSDHLLFDLNDDDRELINVADERPDVADRLTQRLESLGYLDESNVSGRS